MDRIRDDAYGSSSPGGGTGGKVCRVRRRLFASYFNHESFALYIVATIIAVICY